MISLILWVIAPILNAIMDLVENENFGQSIFSKLNPKFWYKRESWLAAKDIGKYSLDAWHIAKSLMFFLLGLSVSLLYFEEERIFHVFKSVWLNVGLDLLLRGLLWNPIFSLFYHKLFRSKTWAK